MVQPLARTSVIAWKVGTDGCTNMPLPGRKSAVATHGTDDSRGILTGVGEERGGGEGLFKANAVN